MASERPAPTTWLMARWTTRAKPRVGWARCELRVVAFVVVLVLSVLSVLLVLLVLVVLVDWLFGVVGLVAGPSGVCLAWVPARA